jgi:hypothetical protein
VKRRLVTIFSALSLLLCVAVGSSGCSRLVDGLQSGGEIENVKGTWEGTLVPIELMDHEGNTYEATAIEIDEGPMLPTAVPQSHGGGRRPVLTTNVLPQRIIPPASLPMGKRVKVSGIMCINTAAANLPLGQFRLLSRYNPEGKGNGLEHVIMVTHAPKPAE